MRYMKWQQDDIDVSTKIENMYSGLKEKSWKRLPMHVNSAHDMPMQDLCL